MNTRRGFFASLASLALGHTEEEPFKPHLPGFISQKGGECGACTTSACLDVCEEGIVMREGGGAPCLDFSRRGCTFCAKCALACGDDLFLPEPAVRVDAQVRIGMLNCLAWNKTICRSCADVCNEKAIRFTGLWNPEVIAERCTACGFCVGVCPGYAIDMYPKESG